MKVLAVSAHPDDETLASRQEKIPEALMQARNELAEGQVAVSLENYHRLINRGENLDEIIEDLREALDSQHSTDTSVWQALGDAYLRSNHLQEALDAYSKAEELLG